MKLLKIIIPIAILAALVYPAIVIGNYLTIPNHNTAATHFDTIIVLGCPAKPDGTPTPEQRERVLEGVREYKAGVAPAIIMTGGAAHNHFVEAHTMAVFAETQGVPASAIIEEGQAHDTIQNIFYSAQIMHDHHWSSAEIVSSPSHLPRAAIIASTFDTRIPALAFSWHTHPAQWPPEFDLAHKYKLYKGEALGCLRLREHGYPPSKFLPLPPLTTSPSATAAHSQSPTPN